MITPIEPVFDEVADALVERGYWVADNILPDSLLSNLLVHFDQLQVEEFKTAGVGRQSDFQVQANIRADKIHWIKADTQTTADFLQWMENLRVAINQRLFMGLFDYESHFAFYPVGAFYKKHVDAFRTKEGVVQSNRVLSTVLYLNQNWLPENGGDLVIYSEDDSNVLEKVSPVFGRLVIFLSEKFPHEVLLATRERKSIAGWFRVNQGAF